MQMICAKVITDWGHIVTLPLEVAGITLVLVESYREDLAERAGEWLGALPRKLRSLTPRNAPVWVPFWLLFGPLASYLTYLPVTAKTADRVLVLLLVSLTIYGVPKRLVPTAWWERQSIAYLLLGPAALPNIFFIVLCWAIVGVLRWMVGHTRRRQLARIGMLLALPGFVVFVGETMVVLAPEAPAAAECPMTRPDEWFRELLTHGNLPPG
jgi:hypothetical protein